MRHTIKKGYQEKIWDHAPGALIVEEAGGVVSDFTGLPLKWTPASGIHVNGGILATNLRLEQRLDHNALLIALSNQIRSKPLH